MSQITLVKQGEIFPQDSPHNSRHARRMRQVAAATSATGKRRGRPSTVAIGQRYGRLTVTDRLDEHFNGNSVFVCRCDCGGEIKVVGNNLTRNTLPINHCGCLGEGERCRPGTRGIGGLRSGSRQRLNNPQRAFVVLLSRYRRSAVGRGYAWELTDEQFLELTQGDCYYCGCPPAQVHKTQGGKHTFVYNGVDRTDNGKPYAAGNCVSCCGVCNIAKRDRNEQEFLEWVKRVYENRIG